MKKITFFVFIAVACLTYSSKANDYLEEYIATYKLASNNLITEKEVNILYEKGKLFLSSSLGKVEIQKIGPDKFAILAYGGLAMFNRNDDKDIIGITIITLGYKLSGKVEKNTTKVAEIKTPTPSKVLLPKWFAQPDDLFAY